MTNPLVKRLFNYFYPRYTEYTWIFYDWVREFIKKDSIVLEIGAGAGLNYPYDFAKISKKVVGIDMDQRVLRNPNLTESLCIDFLDNDFENNSFDIVFANNVVEHIKYPEEFLLEVKRLLKPNGHFFVKTPNLLHYAAIIANFTPFWFHKFYCGLSGRKHEDTFPTCYNLNTSMKVEKLSRKIKFDYQTITLERQPDYLFLEPITFLLGVFYERLVNKYKILNKFIICLMVKISFD